ncbi:hypothetical protein V6L76_18960 [Pannonibacter sp. Pt2]|uniref:Uncharacterized protein n=1 Tax=Pannonibacter anstelovis TaxID=3121537 RepID=A0ABU7ZSZ3_9HYPH
MAFAVQHIFCFARTAALPTLMNVQERTSGGKTMSIVRNLDVIAVCAAFVFLGAIVIGAL